MRNSSDAISGSTSAIPRPSTGKRELSARVCDGCFSRLYELSYGAVKLYFGEPAGNLVEVNCPRATDPDATLIGRLERPPTKQGRSAGWRTDRSLWRDQLGLFL